MFQFLYRLAFLSTFCLSNRTPKITRILTLYQANAPTLTSTVFLIKHTLKLIIFGTHSLQTFRHNILINKVLLMKFYLFNIRPKLHQGKLRKLCITLFQTFLTSPAACWCCCSSNFLYWKLSYKLPGTLKFTIIQIFDQNCVFFTEWCHVDRQCEA